MKRFVTGSFLFVAMTISRFAFGADPFEGSLKFLDTVSRPMPDFRSVEYYEAVPDADGTLKEGIGGSQFVHGWFPQMEQTVGKFSKLDGKLETDVGVYADTVKEEGQKVLDARKVNSSAALLRLNTATGGAVFRLLD